MSAGAMYLNARQSAQDCRLAAGLAAAHGFTRQLQPALDGVAYHDRKAAEIRAQLAAARKLGLRGSAGTVPTGYFADAPCSSRL
jgi:hypothetical protein